MSHSGSNLKSFHSLTELCTTIVLEIYSIWVTPPIVLNWPFQVKYAELIVCPTHPPSNQRWSSSWGFGTLTMEHSALFTIVCRCCGYFQEATKDFSVKSSVWNKLLVTGLSLYGEPIEYWVLYLLVASVAIFFVQIIFYMHAFTRVHILYCVPVYVFL